MTILKIVELYLIDFYGRYGYRGPEVHHEVVGQYEDFDSAASVLAALKPRCVERKTHPEKVGLGESWEYRKSLGYFLWVGASPDSKMFPDFEEGDPVVEVPVED